MTLVVNSLITRRSTRDLALLEPYTSLASSS
jgi:hypothetical protein